MRSLTGEGKIHGTAQSASVKRKGPPEPVARLLRLGIPIAELR